MPRKNDKKKKKSKKPGIIERAKNKVQNTLIDDLMSPLMETFKFMYLCCNYDLTERVVDDLINDKEFNNLFEVCVRDSLKDYKNTSITHYELFNDIKFNLGSLYNYVDFYIERKY